MRNVPVAKRRGRAIVWGPCVFLSLGRWHAYMKYYGQHHAPNGAVLPTPSRKIPLAG